MGNIQHDIDANPEVSKDFEPIPPGRYKSQVVNSEVKPTAAGTGLLLKLTFEILDTDYAGRKVFDQLNIKNPSEQAERIGRGQLSSLCKACGLTGVVSDSTELHEIPLQIKVGIESKVGFSPRNVVKGFYSAESVPRQAPSNVAATVEEDDLPF